MRKGIKETIMERDGLTEIEAQDAYNDAQAEIEEMMMDGDLDALYQVIEDHFGLEPDYLDEFIF